MQGCQTAGHILSDKIGKAVGSFCDPAMHALCVLHPVECEAQWTKCENPFNAKDSRPVKDQFAEYIANPGSYTNADGSCNPCPDPPTQ